MPKVGELVWKGSTSIEFKVSVKGRKNMSYFFYFSYIIEQKVIVAVIVWKQSVTITTGVVSSNLDQGDVYNIMWSSLSVTCDRSVVFSGSSDFLHQ